MLPQIYPDMSRKERKKAMQQAAYKVEYDEYKAPLPTDELSAEQDAYSRKAIELQKMEKEFADLKKKKAAEIKAVKEEMLVALEVINTGKRDMEGSLYMFQDLQKNDMNYFDVNGMWIKSRKIRPEERQTTIFLGNSDVEGGQPTDTEIEEQETEEVTGVDVTNANQIGEGVQMPSEYQAMEPAATDQQEPSQGEPAPEQETQKEEHELVIDSINKAGEVQEKINARRGAKTRQSNREKGTSKASAAPTAPVEPEAEQEEPEIVETSAGDRDAEQPNASDEDDEFKLPE